MILLSSLAILNICRCDRLPYKEVDSTARPAVRSIVRRSRALQMEHIKPTVRFPRSKICNHSTAAGAAAGDMSSSSSSSNNNNNNNNNNNKPQDMSSSSSQDMNRTKASLKCRTLSTSSSSCRRIRNIRSIRNSRARHLRPLLLVKAVSCHLRGRIRA